MRRAPLATLTTRSPDRSISEIIRIAAYSGGQTTRATKARLKSNRAITTNIPTSMIVALARGMGVPGRAVANADDFNKALAEAIGEPGPRLIEVQM